MEGELENENLRNGKKNIKKKHSKISKCSISQEMFCEIIFRGRRHFPIHLRVRKLIIIKLQFIFKKRIKGKEYGILTVPTDNADLHFMALLYGKCKGGLGASHPVV